MPEPGKTGFSPGGIFLHVASRCQCWGCSVYTVHDRGSKLNSHNVVRVAIGVVQGDDGRILITRRRADTVLGGLWEFPGGKLEADETAEQCVVRELMEEVGIDVEVIASFTALRHEYEHGKVQLMPRLCRVVAGEAKPLEVADVAWVEAATLEAYAFPEANGELLAAVRQLAS